MNLLAADSQEFTRYRFSQRETTLPVSSDRVVSFRHQAWLNFITRWPNPDEVKGTLRLHFAPDSAGGDTAVLFPALLQDSRALVENN